jgi:putative tricarboxylic transport membrane protein
MDILHNFLAGFQSILHPGVLAYCFIGVTVGTLIGALPGLGALTAVALLLPITFYLDPVSAIVMLAGIYYGGEYGGSISSILLNLPGSSSSAVTCLEGYPMTRRGKAGVALFLTTVASFFGACVGIIAMMLFAPLLARISLAFGPTEYFSLVILGVVAAGSTAHSSVIKGIAMVLVGLLIGCIGTDVNSGTTRFALGMSDLWDGISLVAVAMGLFGLSEVLSSLGQPRITVTKVSLRSMIPNSSEFREAVNPTIRGTLLGSLLGALPGTGATISSYMAYALEKKWAKDPSRFGHGAMEGLVAPEAANNAAAQTSFIPTLAMGIPGSATMALMLGALMIHGITPGPQMMSEHPDVFWGVIASFWVGNLFLLLLNIPMIGAWVRILSIPFHYFYPLIVALMCIGVYSFRNSTFDVWIFLFFGVLGCLLRKLDMQPAPLLIGMVLGPILEETGRRAMLFSHGDLTVFLTHPISAGLLLAAVCYLARAAWTSTRPASPVLQVDDA